MFNWELTFKELFHLAFLKSNLNLSIAQNLFGYGNSTGLPRGLSKKKIFVSFNFLVVL